MTFSLVGRCARTGMLGAAVTTSSIAVGSRCQHARAAVGAAPVRVVLPGNVVLEIAVSVSVGLASYRGEGDEADALIARADQALYRAKQEGRDRICRFDAA